MSVTIQFVTLWTCILLRPEAFNLIEQWKIREGLDAVNWDSAMVQTLQDTLLNANQTGYCYADTVSHSNNYTVNVGCTHHSEMYTTPPQSLQLPITSSNLLHQLCHTKKVGLAIHMVICTYLCHYNIM